MTLCKHTSRAKNRGDFGRWLDVSLNIAFRVRVSVVCIQCEQTQRKKEIMFSQINAQGKKEGNNQSGVHVFGRNQNIDTDQLKKYGFTTLHWQMGVEWLNKTVH